MKATAKELRFNSKELLNTVNRGEEVVLTFIGKPCAKLVPYKEKNSKTEKNELFGVWHDNEIVQDIDKGSERNYLEF